MTLVSIAIRVHREEAMLGFYRALFATAGGAEFRAVDTFGITSQFAEIDGVTFKFVPIREATDFEGFPSHQLGFTVDDVEAVIALAQEFGGRQEGEILTAEGKPHGACRDPDGNTIELYGR